MCGTSSIRIAPTVLVAKNKQLRHNLQKNISCFPLKNPVTDAGRNNTGEVAFLYPDSCQSDLAVAPSMCSDCMMIHEMCHPEEPNHIQRFYKPLSLCKPDWESRKSSSTRSHHNSDQRVTKAVTICVSRSMRMEASRFNSDWDFVRPKDFSWRLKQVIRCWISSRSSTNLAT
ncbi:MAG: YgjP-like metallopeptidase domain-containing protein [Planctomycetota bacterium]